MKKNKNLVFIAFIIFSFPMLSVSKENSSPESVVQLLKDMCWSGTKVEVRTEADGGVSFLKKGVSGSLKLSKEEVPSIISALNNDLTQLNAKLGTEQADKIRNCMNPYMDLIVRSALGLSNEQRLPKVQNSQSTQKEGFNFLVNECVVKTNDMASRWRKVLICFP